MSMFIQNHPSLQAVAGVAQDKVVAVDPNLDPAVVQQPAVQVEPVLPPNTAIAPNVETAQKFATAEADTFRHLAGDVSLAPAAFTDLLKSFGVSEPEHQSASFSLAAKFLDLQMSDKVINGLPESQIISGRPDFTSTRGCLVLGAKIIGDIVRQAEEDAQKTRENVKDAVATHGSIPNEVIEKIVSLGPNASDGQITAMVDAFKTQKKIEEQEKQSV